MINGAKRSVLLAGCLAVAVSSWLVLFHADLSPKVEGDFFFSTDDPQLQASQRIGEMFPSSDQLLVSATGPDVLADDYLARLRRLTEDLAALPGISSVQSLTQGPTSPQIVPQSPLWSRLLLGSNERSSQLLVFLEPELPSSATELIRQVEELLTEHHAPSFALAMSGVPYVVEQIRRALDRDLKVFSSAALLVFGLVIAGVYRSWRIVAGTLICCLGACAVTLAVLHLLGKPIGLLTANLVTIVFVLTLSHLVFLTANWRSEPAERTDRVAQAVHKTLQASMWCAVTTLLGFASLLFASAQPLRELGVAGAIGTAVALCIAYSIYPAVLRSAADPAVAGTETVRTPRPRPAIAIALLAAALVAATGVPRLDTDPNLLSYFAEDGELRQGLERIDRDGGSSPLLLVVGRSDGERLDTPDAMDRLRRLQAVYDEDPAVGTALSLSLLVDEAQQVPFAGFLSIDRLVDILASPRFERIADSFLTEERTHALFFLRMHEAEKTEPRRTIIRRLDAAVADADLDTEWVGGLYELQASLGELVASSVLRGLAGLFLLFVLIAGLVARRIGIAAAMILSLAAVPLLLLGAFGWLGLPLDIISSPAANVAIALGIDSMIHLVTAVRRHRSAGESDERSWLLSLGKLAPAIAGATAILAAGFGLFALSSFPPTQRFGMAVAGGTIAAAAMAMVVLPWLAQRISVRSRDDARGVA
ncbi:MAG: MMPL family transporter [Thermoanaerobaculia bacterium]|nr:MMPL family transporter [Thermoanaerobaculia bacterium]